MTTLKSLEKYEDNGRFDQMMNKGIAKGIAESRALGIPVEGYLNNDLPLAVPTNNSKKKPATTKTRRAAGKKLQPQPIAA
ncbi:hypothetical protein AGMMS50256_19360 [Betaproteobacteria bacterium]|nr:hypothetical protein AGMMS50256_19360 [Betaproteobacteria bacterium]